ncbi:MAG TPA: metabolite traffic protein EboE [Xenococcaceae cyanobacterium]
MKLTTHDNLHLTYCSNIHPGESWQQVLTNLQNYVPALKTRLASQAPFGIGLRLADIATRELLESDNLWQFKLWLEQANLYVFTLNGFPFGRFHHQIVKDQVYAPDWTKVERLNYTLRLVEILAFLLPPGIEGGISTLPLSYKPWWQKDPLAQKTVLIKSSTNLAVVVAKLIEIRATTGKLLHLDIEPEPDGLIENTTEVIDFFQHWLIPYGGTYLAGNLGISPQLAESQLREHIRLCYDTCHFAVAYEQPATVLESLSAAKIKIGKIQLSAAMKVALPSNSNLRAKISAKLSSFAESTYLHQVIERYEDGSLRHYSDLSTALPYLAQTAATEWRTHFHVPIFIDDYDLLRSSQDDIITVLNLLSQNQFCQHLEIETYTWEVLPSEMKTDLLTSIQQEYEWILNQLSVSSNQLSVTSR